MNRRDLHTNKVDDYCKVITVELITQLIHLLNFQLDYTCAISVDTKNFVFFCCPCKLDQIYKQGKQQRPFVKTQDDRPLRQVCSQVTFAKS